MLFTILKLFIVLSVFSEKAQSQVTLTLATSRPTNNREIELRCTYTGASSCCSLDRIWSRNGVIIMTNGASSSSEKYREEITASSKYFSLKLYNFTDSDVSKTYTCQYGVATSTLTLNRDLNYIYPPEQSCPMTNNKRHISGTLNVTKCQPSPTFVAYYKNTNWTNFLSKTSPVLYDTFFSTQSATLDLPDGLTCGNEETYTLTVITGTVETVICSIDFCRCNFCVLWYFLWSLLGTGIVGIVVMSGIFIKVESLAKLTLRQKLLPGVIMFFSSAVLNLCLAVPLGLKICACIDDTAPWFILLGIGTCSIIAAVIIRCKKPDDEDKAEMLFMVGEYAIFILAWCVCTRDKKQEPPSKPEGPLLVDHNKNSVTIKWKAPKRGMPLTQYIIQIGVATMKPGNKATWKDIAIVKPENETYTIENLEENDYFFRVSAKNAVGVGEPLETDKPVHIRNDKDPAVPPKSGTHSSNSGLLCWASCKVDQEPVNPSKNSAQPKGKATKTPANETNKKPEAKHITTESLETERSYANDKNFESNLNKVPQDRPLPQPNLTPRPLPPKPGALPPITEKKPETIGDIDETTTEKKKKKRRKKEENDEL